MWHSKGRMILSEAEWICIRKDLSLQLVPQTAQFHVQEHCSTLPEGTHSRTEGHSLNSEDPCTVLKAKREDLKSSAPLPELFSSIFASLSESPPSTPRGQENTVLACGYANASNICIILPSRDHCRCVNSRLSHQSVPKNGSLEAGSAHCIDPDLRIAFQLVVYWAQLAFTSAER